MMTGYNTYRTNATTICKFGKNRVYNDWKGGFLMDSTTALGLFFSIVMGFIASNFAAKRGRNPYAWLAIGIFFGILGVIALFLLPPLKKEDDTTSTPLPPGTVTIENVPPEPEQLIRLKDWFCIDTSKAQLGPMNFDALKELWKKGQIVSGSYVWSEGMAAWLPIEQIPALSEELNKEGT